MYKANVMLNKKLCTFWHCYQPNSISQNILTNLKPNFAYKRVFCLKRLSLSNLFNKILHFYDRTSFIRQYKPLLRNLHLNTYYHYHDNMMCIIMEN